MGRVCAATASPARVLAVRALVRAESEGLFVREVLRELASRTMLDHRDEGLALRLALGATATRGCLDELIDRHLDKPSKVKPAVRALLRIGSFEAVYGGVAPRVAVSQAVEVAHVVAPYAASLANAVLRKVCADAPSWLEAHDFPVDQRDIVSRSRHAGLPVWLVRRMGKGVSPEQLDDILRAALEQAPSAVQLHPRVVDDGIGSPLCVPGSRSAASISDMAASGMFACGDAVASDLAAQVVASVATREGSCLELGSGRGTKTYMMCSQAFRRNLSRRHVSVELSAGKCRANLDRLAAAGFTDVQVRAGDACHLDGVLGGDALEGELFDTVFIDAPCSGVGTMRRHPEIPWRLDTRQVDRDLPELQLAMLREGARRVRVGGELLYATCSLLAKENGGVVDAFLVQAGNAFELRPLDGIDSLDDPLNADVRSFVREHLDGRGCMQTLPLSHEPDGHFCARFVRIA